MYGSLYISIKLDIDLEVLYPIPILSVLWLMYVGFEPNNPNSRIKNFRLGYFNVFISRRGMWNFYSIIAILALLMWIYDILIPFINN